MTCRTCTWWARACASWRRTAPPGDDREVVDDLTQQAGTATAAARSDLEEALREAVPGLVGGSRRSHHRRPGGPVVTLPVDTDPAFAAYAHPERLVSTQWLADHLGDERPRGRRERRGRPALRDRPHRRRGQDRLAPRPQRPGHPRLRRRRGLRPAWWAARASAATPPWSSTATRTTGGPPTRCGSSPCSATRTSGCSTAGARSGRPRAASTPPTSRRPRPSSTPSSSATTPRSAPSSTT